jgi:hypothetical protein
MSYQTDDTTTQEVSSKFAEKMELVAKIRQLQADLARLNVDLARAGASASHIECW